MQTGKIFVQGSAGFRAHSLPVGVRRAALRPSVVPRRTFFARAEPREKVEDAAKDAADSAKQAGNEVAQAGKDAARTVEQKAPSGNGSFSSAVDDAGREISKFTQETSGLTKDNTTINKKGEDGKPAFEEAMSFSGQVPERANSRLAMLAFVAAAGAELATGSPVATQLKKSPLLIGATFLVFIVASIIPILRGEDPNKKGAGPFTPQAELWNGRLAMLGFIALLLTETFKNGPAL